MKIEKFTFNGFQENTYVIYDHKKNCIFIDPGCYDRQEKEMLLTFIEENNLHPKAIINTHAHIDHVLGVQFLSKHFQIPFYLHKDDVETLKSVSNYAHLYGFGAYEPYEGEIQLLEDQKEIQFGDIQFQVFHTPGHCPGHVVFYNAEEKIVINGDVLFKGSFGRVDLPGGDMDVLKSSIFNTLFQFPDSTKVYCGHGPETTIGQEKTSNYILQF